MNVKHLVRGSALATLLLAGTALAQTTADLTSLITVTPQVIRGTDDAPIATVLLNAEDSDSDVTVSSLPLSLGSNGTNGHLSACAVRDLADYGTRLNTGSNAIGVADSMNTLTLDEDLTIADGGSVTLVVTCDVAADTPAGTMYTVSVDPSAIEAMDENGDEITPTSALGSDGLTRPTSGNLTVFAIENAPSAGNPLIPGIPNTGAGGDALTWIVLALAGAMMVLGAGFALLRRAP